MRPTERDTVVKVDSLPPTQKEAGKVGDGSWERGRQWPDSKRLCLPGYAIKSDFYLVFGVRNHLRILGNKVPNEIIFTI